MTKRKTDESEMDYLKRKLRRLEKKLKKLPSEPPVQDASPPTPPVNQEQSSKRRPVSTKETHKDASEDTEFSKDSENTEDLIIEEDTLPEELLLALGTEGEEIVELGPEIRSELSARWKKLMATGLGKEARDQIVKKYPAPANFCTEAPKINPEILASLSEISVKRDKRITHRQHLTLKVMNALGRTLTDVLKGKINSNTIVEQINDAAKLCAEIFYEDSSSRKFFALAGANQIIKEAVRETKPDEFLFGKDCAEKIKTAQTIKKAGTQIKNTEQQLQPSSSAKPAKQPQLRRQGNWKGPLQHYQYQQQRARGGHRQTMRKPQTYSSRQELRRHQYRGRPAYRR